MEKLSKISVENLVWKPDKNKQQILDSINVTFEEGGFYGIIGPNGAGKTSLVRQLLKLTGNQGGEIYLDESNINYIKRNDLAKKIAFLPQTINSGVDFTAYEVVAMGRETYRKHFAPLDGTDINAIEEAMEFTDCTKLKDKPLSLMSGGERQRVMIARTIAQDTPWIILDEPVSNLDITHQVQLMKLLEKLRHDKGKTVVAILHDINLASNFCTHIIFMKDGKIFKEGKKEDVLNKENLRELYDMDFDFIERDEGDFPLVVPTYNMVNV